MHLQDLSGKLAKRKARSTAFSFFRALKFSKRHCALILLPPSSGKNPCKPVKKKIKFLWHKVVIVKRGGRL